MTFKDWLQKLESTTAASVGGGMTSTADIAKFSLPIGGMVTRKSPSLITVDDLEKKTKKKVKF